MRVGSDIMVSSKSAKQSTRVSSIGCTLSFCSFTLHLLLLLLLFKLPPLLAVPASCTTGDELVLLVFGHGRQVFFDPTATEDRRLGLGRVDGLGPRTSLSLLCCLLFGSTSHLLVSLGSGNLLPSDKFLDLVHDLGPLFFAFLPVITDFFRSPAANLVVVPTNLCNAERC